MNLPDENPTRPRLGHIIFMGREFSLSLSLPPTASETATTTNMERLLNSAFHVHDEG